MQISMLCLPVAVVLLATCDAFGAARIKAFDPPGAVGTQITGLNSAGTAVGYYYDSPVTTAHGFLRGSSGNITVFDVPGASTGYDQGTFAHALNDSGVVTGTYSTTSVSYHSFVRYSDGSFITFEVPGAEVTGSRLGPMSINNAGEIAGNASEGTSSVAFLRDASGNFSTFFPNGGSTVTLSINASGMIAGTYSDTTIAALHAFTRDSSGAITTYDVPGAIETEAGRGTWATSLNDGGVVAGLWVDAALVNHGYVRNSSGTITSYDVPGASGVGGGGINISKVGTIAGTCFDSNTVFHGFIRSASGMITVFDAPNAGKASSEGTVTAGINAYGQIAGSFVGPKGQSYGFLRTP